MPAARGRMSAAPGPEPEPRTRKRSSARQSSRPRTPRRRGESRKAVSEVCGRGARRARDDESTSGWLGVGDGFDAREEGRDIGSWDNFDEEEDDGMGFKGGWAGDDPIGDADFASNEAARIRRRVTETVDHSLDEKEIWWVATGAEEVGTFGMRAFLEEYADELAGR